MDEFHVYLISTGSLDLYPDNLMSSFRNQLSEQVNLEGDWRVALVEIQFPHSIKNVETQEYFKYFPETPYTTNRGNVRMPKWGDNAKIRGGIWPNEDLLLNDLCAMLTISHKKDPITNILTMHFEDGFGLSFGNRSILNLLGFDGLEDPNIPGHYFIGNHKTVHKSLDSNEMIGQYPVDMTAGTGTIFVYVDIIEYDYVAGSKAPILRIIDSRRRIKNGQLTECQPIEHKAFSDLQFKKLLTNSIKNIQVQLRTETGALVPFVGSGKVILTLKFKKFAA